MDVEALNNSARRGELDITKVSYHAFLHLRETYALLRSGGAMGRGCGPIVVARKETSLDGLKGRRIAVPGRLTTASLLLNLYDPSFAETSVPMIFSDIMPAVARGQFDAGLVIHEGRFTYQNYGLKLVADMGAWWERETGLPIPLGGIIAKRSLGASAIKDIGRLVKASIEYAASHPEESASYIKKHAQEMDSEVIQKHIGLYVNEFSLDMGEEGVRAVEELIKRAVNAGLAPGAEKGVFA